MKQLFDSTVKARTGGAGVLFRVLKKASWFVKDAHLLIWLLLFSAGCDNVIKILGQILTEFFHSHVRICKPVVDFTEQLIHPSP